MSDKATASEDNGAETVQPEAGAVKDGEEEGADGTANRPDKDADAIKLFIGQIPHNMEEEQLKPMFSEMGEIYDLSVIRDKLDGSHRGCAFLTYTTRAAAEKAIDKFHNKTTLPRMNNPLRVQPAEGEQGTGIVEPKLFVGMIPPTADEASIEGLFSPHGSIEEVFIMRHRNSGQSKGCAFVKFSKREEAQTAIDELNNKHTMEGGQSPLVVKFAETRLQRIQRRQAHMAPLYWQGMAYNHQFAAAQNGGQGSWYMYYNPYAYGGYGYGMPPYAYHGMQNKQVSNPVTKGPDGANLFIYHLPLDLTDADLATAFAPFGNVVSAKVYMNKVTGKSKGFGFVSYDNAASADAAISSMNGFQIGNKRLQVQHKRTSEEAAAQRGSEEKGGKGAKSEKGDEKSGEKGSDEIAKEVTKIVEGLNLND